MELEQAGVPTVIVVTEPFEALARQAAAAYDLPTARIVVIEHPIGGVGPDVIEARAAAAEDAVIAALRDERA